MRTTDGDHDRMPGNGRHGGWGDVSRPQRETTSRCAGRPAPGRVFLLLIVTVWAANIVGCLGTDNSKLVGRWQGQIDHAPADDGLDSESKQPGTNSKFTTTLDFRPDYRFSMELVGADGQVHQTDGTWQIDQATGSRWEVTLRQDDVPANVRLRIAFDKDGFTARQVDGDDRIASIQFRRVDN